MAVEVVYRSSRDLERLFMDKAEADRHDKMLELAEALAAVLQQASPSLSEQQAEDIGIFMARHRELFAKAFKSSPEALAELSSQGNAKEHCGVLQQSGHAAPGKLVIALPGPLLATPIQVLRHDESIPEDQ